MTKANDDVDHLFEVRNNFYLGAYQNCINEAQNLQVKDENDKLLKDVFMYRAYLAQNKPNLVLSEIEKSSTSPSLRAVRRFADYLANPDKRAVIMKEFETELNEEIPHNETVLLLAAHMYIHERLQNVEEALRLLCQCDSLESKALAVQCLLKIDRIDLAVKEIKRMQEIDEDATITQLALAWVNIALGKDKLKDVFYTYQEMIDKYGATPLLLVAQSSSLIQQQKYEEAEKLLLEALQRDANNAEAVINLVVVSQYLGKAPEVTNRYINQLKEGFPNHQWTLDYIAREKAFERVALEAEI
ncbi:Coatomer epsilon subunit family protein [Brugia malayi]|uniref:Coatomer subunit epsilon n=1 Tax=Brugia malayi TaxID=6279 RepID=A0A0H5SFL8_BRUMA|nr:Coatomer epsilon subunit family protein [Brugia malayi]CRZ22702.1 BMA-COPE-1 [Brugia malayi]VIO88555.1 Coatomer epsilon subunit family protein [Brugia malayi]